MTHFQGGLSFCETKTVNKAHIRLSDWVIRLSIPCCPVAMPVSHYESLPTAFHYENQCVINRDRFQETHFLLGSLVCVVTFPLVGPPLHSKMKRIRSKRNILQKAGVTVCETGQYRFCVWFLIREIIEVATSRGAIQSALNLHTRSIRDCSILIWSPAKWNVSRSDTKIGSQSLGQWSLLEIVGPKIGTTHLTLNGVCMI